MSKDNQDVKPAENIYENGDLLDSPQFAGRFTDKGQSEWEQRTNTILDRHPFICGYLFLALLITALATTHLTTFAISFLFLYLISDFITNDVRRHFKFLPKALLFSVLYLAVISLLIVVFYRTIPNIIKQLPSLALQLQSQAIDTFEKANARWDIARYVDPNEVRDAIIKGTTNTIRFFVAGFRSLYTGFIYFIFALVINLLLYHNIAKVDSVFERKPNSLATFLYQFVKRRVQVFYFYFKRVMGGQIIISAINTVISAVAIFALQLPRPFLLISLVFFFGLFPVIGNVVSNTILTATALVSIGWVAAVICLGLLVGIHKLEYFLNSKIIGEIVHLPMVVTLAAIVIAEVLLGILGLILAIPLVLALRYELEHIPGYGKNSTAPPLLTP